MASRATRPLGTRSRNLPELAYAAIRRQISDGRLAPGDRLTEAAIAEALGISRTPVREGLLALAREGLLVKHGRSFCLPPLTLQDINEIHEMRQFLEPPAIRWAAGAMSASTLAQLSEALLAQKAAHAANRTEAFIAANGAFRSALLATISNRRLRRAIEIYGDHIHVMRSRLRYPRWRELVIRNLSELVRAMRARDADGCARVWSKHIDDAQASAREWLAEINSTEIPLSLRSNP
jgi:DNA-binding GntR family transcriptional regulator